MEDAPAADSKFIAKPFGLGTVQTPCVFGRTLLVRLQSLNSPKPRYHLLILIEGGTVFRFRLSDQIIQQSAELDPLQFAQLALAAIGAARCSRTSIDKCKRIPFSIRHELGGQVPL